METLLQMTAAQVIRQTYQDLSIQVDLSPNNELVNMRLKGLVHTLGKEHCSGDTNLSTDTTLSTERVELPRLCGKAECAMEHYWAQKFINNPNLTPTTLKSFWYYSNYQTIWELEKHLIGQEPLTRRMVFLGSGSLPLTVIIACLEMPLLQVICVDFDEQSCKLSSELIDKLGLNKQIKVENIAAQSFPFKENDFVICASLIEQKEQLYTKLYNAGIPSFALRDAEDVYCYLYTPSPIPDLGYYKEIRRTIPVPECINTTRYFERIN